MPLALFLIALCIRGDMATKEIVNLAVFLPKSGSWSVGKTIAPAAQLAADYVNNNDQMLSQHTINITYYDTGCNQGKAIWQLIREIKTKKRMDGIIGGACNPVCEVLGLFASHHFLPVISWGCQSTRLSNKFTYPTFARTVGSRKDLISPIIALLRHYNWKRFSIFSSLGESYEYVSDALLRYAEEKEDFTVQDVVATIDKTEHTSEDHETRVLEHLLKRSKVILFCASPAEVRNRMLLLQSLDKLTGEYVFISFDVTSESLLGDDGRDEDAKKAFQGLININLKKPEDEKYREFEERIRTANQRAPFNHVMKKDAHVDTHAGMLYDSVLLYALSLDDSIVLGNSIAEIHFVSKLLFNRKFKGVTGDVHIDGTGDRKNVYSIQIYSGDDFINIGEYSAANDALETKEGIRVVFIGGSTDVPLDRPVCGWDNELCSGSTAALTGGLICGAIGLVVVLSFCAAFLYRKLKFENDMKKEDFWRIKPEELQHGDDNNCSSSLNRFQLDESLTENLIYKGMAVHLTRIPEGGVFVDRQLIVSLRQVRELHHENINPVIGLSIDEPFKGILTSYASRGSLADVLSNTNVNISSDFKLSFMLDICKGMECLHGSPIDFHGRLKSANCVVDNRWVCKVTDFGLRRIRIKDDLTDDGRKYSALLYTAPEILRQAKHSNGGSKPGDVYSFGIIMQEIITLVRPYQAITSEEPKEIVRLVELGLDPPYRPTLPKDMCPMYICKLMLSCWDEDAMRRPTFTGIIKKFDDSNDGKVLNILDKTCQMLEQYTNHLEELVSERTTLLNEERVKTDRLLYQMLPRFIADPLKLGEQVAPQAYEKATVYFSDVVAFTNIASESTPLEVVNFLNDLYSAFDCIVEKHDVYKIETIGDAYVAVSGVPDPNGNQHAAAVASLSLDILSFISNFTIRHMPRRQLKLRIGVHSGPVAAGVVGVKMPRYCLFGETVNIAAMMEANGEALKIHVSQTTKDILDEVGGYTMEQRGNIEITDVGMMTTYWLLHQNHCEDLNTFMV